MTTHDSRFNTACCPLIPISQKEPINAEVGEFNPKTLKKTETKEKNPLPTKAGKSALDHISSAPCLALCFTLLLK
uniref:Uncharacterized protein n=1 Tax=Cyclopterus lumpus TaxID=8103 RepID=A0A8C3AD39_CYCLU